MPASWPSTDGMPPGQTRSCTPSAASGYGYPCMPRCSTSSGATCAGRWPWGVRWPSRSPSSLPTRWGLRSSAPKWPACVRPIWRTRSRPWFTSSTAIGAGATVSLRAMRPTPSAWPSSWSTSSVAGCSPAFILAWALVTCYSRAYLGVHYPGDLLAGAVLGFVGASLCYGLFQKICRYSRPEHPRQLWVPVAVGGVTVVGMLVYSFV